MKQFIILLLILGGGYYFYTHGLQQTFKKINLEPKTLVKEQVKESNSNNTASSATAQQKGLPEIAPERLAGLKMSSNNMNKVEEVIFNTYDADTCFAYVEMVYSSGSSASPRVINKYLTTFDVPEDRNKIIPLITKYKDKQSLKILEDLMKRGAFSKKMLLNKIAQYDTDESIETIKRAAEGSDSLAGEAKAMLSELVNFNKMESGKKQPAARRMQMLMDNPNASQGEFQ